MRAVRREIPGHADARLEVPIVLLIDLVDVDADAHERRARRVEDDEPVVPLRGRDVPLVAQSEFERDGVAEGDVVLDEQAHGALVDHASPFAERGVERIRRSGQECLHAREVEHARALGEVLVDEVPVLAANFHRVPAARAAERVDEDIRRVESSLGQGSRPAEVEIARHDHLRQADRTRDAISDVEVRRIERSRRKGATREVTPAESRFVQRRGAEHVRFIDRQDARGRVGHAAEPRNAVALRAWLDAIGTCWLP